MPRVSVLVVDDSAFMRRAIVAMLEREPAVEVIATARSGEEAIEKSAQLLPDVVTMDVEMGGMSGLDAVRAILAHRRVPIIMVSALTKDGAETTFRALELGAVDFIAKPDAAYANINDVARDLVVKVLAFGSRRGAAENAAPRPTPSRSPQRSRRDGFACVAIGTSTGGPVALSRVIPALPAEFAVPIVVVQHMPRGFTRPLAERLNAQSALRVLEASDGTELTAGCVAIVPSGRHVALARDGERVAVRLVEDDGSSLHVPSADRLFESMAALYGARAIGVVLTGMGQDGLRGMRALKASGGYAIGQDERSSVVYGMPRAVAQAGLLDRSLPLDEIAAALNALVHDGRTVVQAL